MRVQPGPWLAPHSVPEHSICNDTGTGTATTGPRTSNAWSISALCLCLCCGCLEDGFLPEHELACLWVNECDECPEWPVRLLLLLGGSYLHYAVEVTVLPLPQQQRQDIRLLDPRSQRGACPVLCHW